MAYPWDGQNNDGRTVNLFHLNLGLNDMSSTRMINLWTNENRNIHENLIEATIQSEGFFAYILHRTKWLAMAYHCLQPRMDLICEFTAGTTVMRNAGLIVRGFSVHWMLNLEVWEWTYIQLFWVGATSTLFFALLFEFCSANCRFLIITGTYL